MFLDKITPIDYHLAKKLREFRRTFGMSQDKLSELAGLSFQQIQKYEKAQNRISASRLFEFAQLLERPISDFFEGIEADRSYYTYDFTCEEKQRQNAEEFDRDILTLINAYKRIENSQTKRHLLALAVAIARPKEKKVKHCYS